MNTNITIIIAEDDEGHAYLIKRNLKKAGIANSIIHFKDGEEVLNFFSNKKNDTHFIPENGYIILLDIKMPKIDGTEVLETMKSDPVLRKIPIVMITTTDAPAEVELCHSLGCNSYIVKPIDYEKFIDVVKKLGYFLSIVEVPKAG